MRACTSFVWSNPNTPGKVKLADAAAGLRTYVRAGFGGRVRAVNVKTWSLPWWFSSAGRRRAGRRVKFVFQLVYCARPCARRPAVKHT